jgi:ABC-type transporter Mla MlaB component
MELIRSLVQRLRNTNEMIEQLSREQEKIDPKKKWSSPFGVVLDSTKPGKFVINGVMTLPNLIQLLKLEMKKKTPEIVLDFSKVTSMDKECTPALLSIYTRLKAREIDIRIRGSKKALLYLFKHKTEEA